MILSQFDLSFVHIHQWLNIIFEVGAIGLLELYPDKLIIKVSNHVNTSFAELTIKLDVMMFYQEQIYVNINLFDVKTFLDEWIKMGFTEGSVQLTTDHLVFIGNENNESKIPVTFSRTGFVHSSDHFMELDHFACSFHLPELQNMIRELSVIGCFATIDVDAQRELALSTIGKRGRLSFQTRNNYSIVQQDDFDHNHPLSVTISLCDMKMITLLNTSRGIIRIIPDQGFMFESSNVGGVKLMLCICSNKNTNI